MIRIKTEIYAAVAALLFVQIITSFGAIALLSRMSPAIEQILRENVYSIEAVEQMLMVLASSAAEDAMEPEDPRWGQFEAALQRARQNVTEAEEPPVLAEISAHYKGALRHDPEALAVTLGQLRLLAQINHTTMERADGEAKTLGFAGAWAGVFLGLLGFVLSLLIIRRLNRRVIDPLLELHNTVVAFQTGNLHRRSRKTDFPLEFADVAEALNSLLDAHQTGSKHVSREPVETLSHSVALRLLDDREHPTVVVDLVGDVIAANKVALELFGTKAGDRIRAEAGRLAARPEEFPKPGFSVEKVGADGWLCEITPGALMATTSVDANDDHEL